MTAANRAQILETAKQFSAAVAAGKDDDAVDATARLIGYGLEQLDRIADAAEGIQRALEKIAVALSPQVKVVAGAGDF